MSPETILLVEDNEDDAFFMKQAMKDAEILNPMREVEDGRKFRFDVEVKEGERLLDFFVVSAPATTRLGQAGMV